MVAKMRVRRSLLPSLQNFNVLNMLKFTLWNQDIFPIEAFEDLNKKHPGKSNLDALLDISPKLPEDIAKQAEDKSPNLGNKGQGYNQLLNQRKRNTRRGSRGGQNRHKPRNGQPQSYQKKGTPQHHSGYNKPRNNQYRGTKHPPKKGGKPFQKGKQDSSL